MCSSRATPLRLFLALAASTLIFSCMPYELKSVLDGAKGAPLSLSPTATVVTVNSPISFAAGGGVEP